MIWVKRKSLSSHTFLITRIELARGKHRKDLLTKLQVSERPDVNVKVNYWSIVLEISPWSLIKKDCNDYVILGNITQYDVSLLLLK